MPIAHKRSWKNRISISNTFRHFIWSNPAVVFVVLQTLWCQRWKTWWTMKELQLTQWPQSADQAGDSPAVKCPCLLSRYKARSSGQESSIVTQMSTYFDAIHESGNALVDWANKHGRFSEVHSLALKVLSTPASWAPVFSGEEDGRMISHCACWGHRMLQLLMLLQCNQNLFKPVMVHKRTHVKVFTYRPSSPVFPWWWAWLYFYCFLFIEKIVYIQYIFSWSWLSLN